MDRSLPSIGTLRGEIGARRADDHQLECFFTCKAPRRAAWMAAHIVDGDWRPASAPKSKDERRSLLAKYQEGSDRSIKGQRTDLTSSTVAASSSTDDPMPVPNPSPPSAVSEPHLPPPRHAAASAAKSSVLSQPSHASLSFARCCFLVYRLQS